MRRGQGSRSQEAAAIQRVSGPAEARGGQEGCPLALELSQRDQGHGIWDFQSPEPREQASVDSSFTVYGSLLWRSQEVNEMIRVKEEPLALCEHQITVLQIPVKRRKRGR